MPIRRGGNVWVAPLVGFVVRCLFVRLCMRVCVCLSLSLRKRTHARAHNVLFLHTHRLFAGGMKGDVDPCLRVGVLSASPLPRSGGGTEASSWVVEAKVGMFKTRRQTSWSNFCRMLGTETVLLLASSDAVCLQSM